eukprot:4300857-Amphidinium_carterae.1
MFEVRTSVGNPATLATSAPLDVWEVARDVVVVMQARDPDAKRFGWRKGALCYQHSRSFGCLAPSR